MHEQGHYVSPETDKSNFDGESKGANEASELNQDAVGKQKDEKTLDDVRFLLQTFVPSLQLAKEGKRIAFTGVESTNEAILSFENHLRMNDLGLAAFGNRDEFRTVGDDIVVSDLSPNVASTGDSDRRIFDLVIFASPKQRFPRKV